MSGAAEEVLDEFLVGLDSEAQQEAFGARLAAVCHTPMLIFLHGDLGAGKTTLTRGFLRGLGFHGAVKSPTYTLIEPYLLGGQQVYHLDLYRVGDPGELEYLGLRELLDEPVALLIEWPENGKDWLPAADMEIDIVHRAGGRDVRVLARSTPARNAVRLLREPI